MTPTPGTTTAPKPPSLPLALLRRLLPRAERDEVIADLTAEYAELIQVLGEPHARRWIWRQALQSVPALIRWNLWRDRTGFEPPANAFRPGVPMIATLLADAHFAARRLRTRAGYTVLAVLTLSLGIGGTAAVFGVARPLVLDPLPYANAGEVGTFWFEQSWNEEEFTYLRGDFPGFRSVAAYGWSGVTMRDGDAPARHIPAIVTSHELFDVLGARPMIGRDFQPADDAPSAEPVVMLSHRLWRELGADASIVGSRLVIDGTPRTVAGVMPRGFWFPDPSVGIWVTLPLDPEGRNGYLTLVGRVAAGHDVRNMSAPLQRLGAMIDERFDYPEQWDKTRNPAVTPIRDVLLGSMRPALVATFVAMGLILLIACANVSALMLGQVEGRTTEMAVRSALGATRRRLMQQVVVEALLIGVAAGLAGAGLAAAGFDLLAGALPIGVWADSVAFDWTVFALALSIAMAAVLLVVLIPAVSFWRGDSREGLHRARTGGIEGRGGRLERGLVVAEVALAMLIASGAALLVRSVSNLHSIDPGFTSDGVAVLDVVASSDLPQAERVQRYEMLAATLAALPGVNSAAASMKLPLRGPGFNFGVTVEGRPDLPPSTTFFRIATRGYFETMGIELVAGRTFDVSDQPGAELPIVVNEALVKKLFPDENPIGRVLGGGYSSPQRIIGVVRDVAEGNLTDDPAPARYYLAGTVPWMMTSGSLVFRMNRPSEAGPLLDAARREVQRVAPEFAVQNTTTMSHVFEASVGPARQLMSLLALLSALAMVLGAIGIYGVIAHFAARRRRDWAIRVALGLRGSRVVGHVVRQGVVLVMLGVTLGGLATLAMTRVLESFLHEVSAADPLAYGAAGLALLVIGVVAALVPAWRTASVDPVLVLREQ